MAAAGLLVLLIVREHTTWPPGPWIAMALFLALDTHRFDGGFPRGFLHVVVLLTVLLALRGRNLAAALVAAGGVLFYPPAALLSVGVLLVAPTAPRRTARGGALRRPPCCPTCCPAGRRDVLTAAEARAFPEFGQTGPLHFFVDSTREYLAQNRSGLDLRALGQRSSSWPRSRCCSLRPANLRLLRPRSSRCRSSRSPRSRLAHAVLFRLYLPHRYTYSLVAFAAIVVGVALRPTWEAVLARPRRRPARVRPPARGAGGDRAGACTRSRSARAGRSRLSPAVEARRRHRRRRGRGGGRPWSSRRRRAGGPSRSARC